MDPLTTDLKRYLRLHISVLYTADSGVHHIAAAMAGCAILLDCMAGGQLVDDRPPATGGVADVLNSYHKERSE